MRKNRAPLLLVAAFSFGLAPVHADELPDLEKAAEKGSKEAISQLLDKFLFRAEGEADLARAKKVADLARAKSVDLGFDTQSVLETVDRCFEAGAAEIPKGDLPSAEEKAAFAGAQTECLDLLVPERKDWARYRKCLLSDSWLDRNSLAEIYANGWGVKRDPRLALALVCHGGQVPAEMFAMVRTLASTRAQERLDPEFRFCDHITSGMNGGLCASRAERIARKRGDAEAASLSAGWTAAQKAAFSALQAAAEAFFDERSSSELDMTGTARASIAISEQAALRAAFLKDVRDFEAGKLPIGGDLAAADRQLNAVYAKLLAQKPASDLPGAVTPTGVRASQRKWIKYRDAWARFGVARYPSVPRDGWEAWLTRQRIEQLSR